MRRAKAGNFFPPGDTTLLTGGYVTSDEELMDEIRRGSRAAFETLFGRYREPIWRFFRRRTPDGGRAEELAQDVFVALLDGAARYEQRGPVRSYLFGIAYHVLQADRRKAAHRATDPLDTDPPDLDITDPDRSIWVRDALRRLDEDDREVLMLREYEQLSYQEIADLRGAPLNTVRSQLFRARMALKSALETRAPQVVRTHHAR
jgi:RNA polymerase sigma-70 factor (ECF subfamily)